MNRKQIRKGKWGFMTMLIAISFAFSGAVSADVYVSEEVRIDSNTTRKNTVVSIESNMIQSLDDNGNVFVLWQRAEDLATFVRSHHYYFNRSMDGGRTWLEHDVRLTDSSESRPLGDTGVLNAVMCHDNRGNIYVSWATYSTRSIGFRHSSDYGATWGEILYLQGFPDVPEDHSRGPRIACDSNGRVYVAWFAWDGYMHLNYSSDYGETWLPRGTQFDDSIRFGPKNEVIDLQIASDENGRVFVSWIDDRDIVIPYEVDGHDISTTHTNTMRYVTIATLPHQIPADEIFVNAHPDQNSKKFPDVNMLDNDNSTVWKGKKGWDAAPWCIELDFSDKRTLDTLEIDWEGGNTGIDFDILDMSEEGFALNGTPGTCNGKVILGGLSQDPNTDGESIATSVIELDHYTTSKLGIRINQAGGNMPIISEIRVKVWD